MARKKKQFQPTSPFGSEAFEQERKLGVMPVSVMYEILKEIMPDCPSYKAVLQFTRRVEYKLANLLTDCVK